MEKYQGWANWHTWNCNLHLTNDESAYKRAKACTNAAQLKMLWDWVFSGKDGIKSDLVNFEEIFEYLKE